MRDLQAHLAGDDAQFTYQSGIRFYSAIRSISKQSGSCGRVILGTKWGSEKLAYFVSNYVCVLFISQNCCLFSGKFLDLRLHVYCRSQ